jgi:uncharacterized protein YijF (DUF1287 family)
MKHYRLVTLFVLMGLLFSSGPTAGFSISRAAASLPESAATAHAGSAPWVKETASTSEPTNLQAQEWVTEVLGNAPLAFIENVGQFNAHARFQARSASHILWLADDALWITLLEPGSEGETTNTFGPSIPNPKPQIQHRRGVNLRLSFVGASSHTRLEGFDRLDTNVSYFVGNDPDQWHSSVPVWHGARYHDLYPGVDLELSGDCGQLSWRLVVKDSEAASQLIPRPSRLANVRLRLEGADWDNFVLPVVAADGSLIDLSTHYPLFGGTETVAPLALSPLPRTDFATQPSLSPQDNPHDLLYSTFLGGNDLDYGQDITFDKAGNVYVTGSTYSPDFPSTPGTFDTNPDAKDAFVVKVNTNRTGLVYATFLGGSGWDKARGISVDASGNAYVTGETGSTDFPTTPGAYDTSCDDWTCGDAFTAKVNPDGTDLVYATCIGGRGTDSGSDIRVDEAGNAYVVGINDFGDFPATPGAFDTSYNGGQSIHNMGDVFVVKLNTGGTDLVYATYLGGKNADYGLGIALDRMGNVYVTGSTQSPDFPTTAGAFDRSCGTDGECNEDFPISRGYGGPPDAFVVKLNSSGTGLVYATFLGGSDDDTGDSIALDGSGYVYVTGTTLSPDFPTTFGAFDRTCGTDGNCNPSAFPTNDAFVTKVNTSGTGLIYATFLGGSTNDRGTGIAVDEGGNTYVTGMTNSFDFPTTPGAFDTTCGTDSNCNPDSHGNLKYDVFASKVDMVGSSLTYSTFLGGDDSDCGYSIAVDEPGSILATGSIRSTNFPITVGAFDTTYNGGSGDAFVAKLMIEGVAREARADIGMPYASGGYRGCPSPYVGCGGPYHGFYYGVCTDLAIDAYNAGAPFNLQDALRQDHLAHPGRYRYRTARNPEDMRRYFHYNQQWLPHSQTYQPGDIAFFDWDTDGLCDHVGVISEVDTGDHPTQMVHATGVCWVNPSGRAFEQDWNSHYDQHIQGHGRLSEAGSLSAPADEPLQLLRITVDSPGVALSLRDANGKSTSAIYDENLVASGVEASIPYIPGGWYADRGTEQVITVTWPLSNTSQYSVQLTGQSATTYHLRVETLQGASVTDSEVFTQTTAAEETHGSMITLSAPGGDIQFSAMSPAPSPLLGVPESLTLGGLASTSAQETFTVAETGGQQPLQDVTISATDLMDSLGETVAGSLLSIAPTDFAVSAGGSQQVDVQISLANVAPGTYRGALVIRSDSNGTQMVPLTLAVQFHHVYLPTVLRSY